MILLHHPEVELSRTLLAALPEGCDLVDWTDVAQRMAYTGPPPSAFPTVVVDVAAYAQDSPLRGPDGEFLGMARVIVPAHQEALRMPATWEAVESFVSFAANRPLT